MARRLGVDLGNSRIGFAICDEEERIASPLKNMPGGSMQKALQSIMIVLEETKAASVVLGHPRNMNGRAGAKAREAEELARALQERKIEVVLWDERLTTSEADRFLKSAEMNRKQRKRVIDAVAAQLILESYLSAQHGKGE